MGFLIMSNFSDFIGGSGGGANIPYKGSTAEVTYLPVAQGTYQNLDSAGNIVPASSVVTDIGAISQFTIATANGWTTSRAANYYEGGRAENTMPNGNSLFISIGYDSATSNSIIFTVLDSAGSPLSYYEPYSTNNWTNYAAWSTQYIGEDSQYYLFSVFLTGRYSDGNQYSLIVKVAKSDYAITANQVTTTASSNNTQAQETERSAPRQYLARDKSVYCAEFVSAVSSASSQTITISTGTVNSSYAPSQVTTSTFTIYENLNVSLTKYDDGSGNFLLMYSTGTTSLVFKKILVAANGSHTVTDVTPTGLSLGTTASSQLRPNYAGLLESEVAGKYLLAVTDQKYQANYQKLSYNGTAVTASGFQKYEVGDQQVVNYIFFSQNNNFAQLYNMGQWFYRYAEDKMYLAPRATNIAWSNYLKGAVWTLGSGNVVNTAVETDIFSDFTTSSTRLVSTANNGFVSSTLGYSSITLTYLMATTSQIWSTLGITKAQVAYVRQAGDVGDTVNISLVEGITSSDTLSSTYFLSKGDFYYPLDSILSGGPSTIKSIQRGTNTFSADGTITIDAVDINKSFINYERWSTATYNPNTGLLTLLNPTTLSFDWYSGTTYVGWEVIEYV